MAQKATIKKDSVGLYVVAGSWICRPYAGTIFREGDKVKSHHFGGSTKAGVTFNDINPDFNFKRHGKYEIWITTGVMSFQYVKQEFEPNKYAELFGKPYTTFDEYLDLGYEWYKKQALIPEYMAREKNQEFGREYSNLLV